MKLIKCAFLALFAAAFMVSSCSGGKESESNLALEMGAKQLLEKAQQFERSGQDREAEKIYKEMAAKYSATKTFADAKADLLKRGISIEDSLVSETSMLMFKLQNLLVDYRKANGEYPTPHTIKIPKDSWGHPLIYEIAAKESEKPYEFFIISKGADGKLKTEDDIYVIYTGKKSEAIKEKLDSAEEKRQEVADGEERGPSGAGSGDTMKLEALEKTLAASEQRTGAPVKEEKRLSLEELQQVAKEKKDTGKSGGGEMVMDLDSLMKKGE